MLRASTIGVAFAASVATTWAPVPVWAAQPEATASEPSAARVSVTVPPIEGLDSFPAADQERLHSRLRDGISRAGFLVAEGNDADAIVNTKVTNVKGDYEVVAEFEQPGQDGFSVSDVCELCGVDELGETLASMGSRLQRRASQLSDDARLKVTSTPSGAEVRLNGEMIGTTPLDTEVPAGSYELTVYQDGYTTESKSVSLEPATQAEYSLSLKRTGYKRWVPWTLLGTGIVAAAAGASLLVIDEEPIRSDCNPDVDGRCQFLYDTLGGGIALTAVGAGLIITGAALAIVWRKKKGPTSAAWRLQPSRGGLAVRF